jgi:hypothetical protein
MMLTANDIMLVRASFARVAPIKDAAADLFYGRLFEVAPQLRPLFPADLRAEAEAHGDDRHGSRRIARSRCADAQGQGARHAPRHLWRDRRPLRGRRRGLVVDARARPRRCLHVGRARGVDQSCGVLAATMQAGAADLADMQAAE